MSARRSRRTVVVVLLVNLACAWGFRYWLLQTYDVGTPWVAGITHGHAEMARNLVEGRGWVVDQALSNRAAARIHGSRVLIDLEDVLDGSPAGEYVPFVYPHAPGYSLWLAASYLIAGEYRYMTSRVMQITLDSLATLLAFGMAAMLAGPGAGVVAAMLYALSPAHALLPTMAVQAALEALWLLLVSFGAILAWAQVRDGRRPLGGAAVVALAALCGAAMNSTAFVYPAALVAMCLLAAPFSKFARTLAGWFLLAQIAVALALMPWAARNKAVFDQFTPIRGTGWQVVWSTWGDQPNPWGLGLDDKHYFNWLYENCTGACDAREWNRLSRDYILGEVVPSPEFPRFVLDLVRTRAGQFGEPLHIAPGELRPGAPGAGFAPVLAALDTLVVKLWLVLSPLALVALAWGARDKILPVVLGLTPTLFLLGFNLVTFVSVRKTTPAYAFLCVLAGIGAWVAVAWVIRHRPWPGVRARRQAGEA